MARRGPPDKRYELRVLGEGCDGYHIYGFGPDPQVLQERASEIPFPPPVVGYGERGVPGSAVVISGVPDAQRLLEKRCTRCPRGMGRRVLDDAMHGRFRGAGTRPAEGYTEGD